MRMVRNISLELGEVVIIVIHLVKSRGDVLI